MASKVFISSTGYDLQDYRQAAFEICNRLGFTPVAMEFFESMGIGATEGSKRKLDTADVYVGIIAYRYGYIEDGYSKAVTEIEFDYAGERNLDRLCFVANPNYPWPPEAIDYENYERLQALKARLDQKVIRTQFSTVDDFRAKLTSTLTQWQRDQSSGSVPTVTGDDASVEAIAATPPPRPALVVGREADLDRIAARFGIRDTMQMQPLTIVRGWPGVGKTTLVTKLAYEPDVAAAFPDGVLWAALGESPDPLAGLISWGRTLGVRNVAQGGTVKEAMERLRALLYDKRMLLIVDDVWTTVAAAPFQVGGPKCATLVTTRFQDVARELATTPDDIYVLEQLGEDKALRLLSQLAPTVVAQYPQESRQLIHDLEGLPLAIRVAGRLLEDEAKRGWEITDLLEELAEGTRLLRLAAPEDRFDPEMQTIPTVSALLEKSTDRLDQETRDRFAFLGVFAPKPATFDLDAMQAMWLVDDARPTARKLADRGLLEPIIGTGRFQMHAVLVLHAKSLLERESEPE